MCYYILYKKSHTLKFKDLTNNSYYSNINYYSLKFLNIATISCQIRRDFDDKMMISATLKNTARTYNINVVFVQYWC